MNQILKPFNMENLSQIINVVKPMWTIPSWNEPFKQINCEFIVRSNICQNEFSLQLLDRTESANNTESLLAAVFAAKKSDKNNAKQWLTEKSVTLTTEEKTSANMSLQYIEYMDSKVHALMNDDDIKLSLFVSCKKGFGNVIFEELWNRLKKQGYKNMYLWTDCDCNWQWYIKKGFSLVEESIYKPFSDKNTDYKIFVFKKAIG